MFAADMSFMSEMPDYDIERFLEQEAEQQKIFLGVTKKKPDPNAPPKSTRTTARSVLKSARSDISKVNI